MDAERAIELLPWYVNGGLEPDERREVADALAASAEVRRELAEVRRAFELHGYRLEPDVLLDYALGLEPEGVTRETVEKLATLLPVVREELGLVREGLEALQVAGAPATAPRPAVAVAQWRLRAVAAALLAAAFLGAWAWSEHRLSLRTQEAELLRGRLAEMGPEGRPAAGERVVEPSADLLVTDLFPAGMVLRGEDDEAGAATVVPRETRHAVLLLNSRLPETAGVAALALRDAAGVEVWRSSGPVRRGEHGEYVLLLPLGELTAGAYTLELLGGEPDRPTVLEVYRLRVG